MTPTRLLAFTAMVGTFVPLLVSTAAPTAASGTAQVRLVDNYGHGRIEVSVNGVTHHLGNGDRVGPFAVTPDSMGNDGITVRSMRYDGCGIAKIGKYFRAGHVYRIRVNKYRGGRCHVGGGRTIPGPSPHLAQLS